MRATIQGKDDFQLERKLQTKYWSTRVNTSILGMNYVDTYYLGKSCECQDDSKPTESNYNLAEGMIYNQWNERSTRETRQYNLYNILIA